MEQENEVHRGKNPKKNGRFNFLQKISVEPCIALFGLAYALYGVQVPTLYIQKTCKVGSFFFSNTTFSTEVRHTGYLHMV